MLIDQKLNAENLTDEMVNHIIEKNVFEIRSK